MLTFRCTKPAQHRALLTFFYTKPVQHHALLTFLYTKSVQHRALLTFFYTKPVQHRALLTFCCTKLPQNEGFPNFPSPKKRQTRESARIDGAKFRPRGISQFFATEIQSISGKSPRRIGKFSCARKILKTQMEVNLPPSRRTKIFTSHLLVSCSFVVL